MTENTANVPTLSDPITLDTPIVRGEQTIGFVQIRKPSAGELRGLSMADIARLDVGAMLQLIPRVSIPPITPDEAAKLEPADLFACATEIGSFLLSKVAMEAFPQA